MTEVIYPFLHSSFRQSIAISKIVDFNVFDVVTVLLVHLAGDGFIVLGGRRPDDWRSERLQNRVSKDPAAVRQWKRTERIGGTSTCWMPFFAWICALILAAAAAAAAAALFLVLALDGLSVSSRVTAGAGGLRSRCASDSLRDGDLERRSVSKRERVGRSGSSLSKRDRGRRSSDMLARGGSAVTGGRSEVVVAWLYCVKARRQVALRLTG